MKIQAIAAGVTGLFIVGAAGAVVYSGMAANQRVDKLIADSERAQSPVRLVVVDREQGLASSSGTVRVSFNGACLGEELESLELAALVRYQISHLPGLQGLSSYSADLVLEGGAAELLQSASGAAVALHLDSVLGFNARWASRFTTPALDFPRDDLRVQVAASAGEFTQKGQAGAFAWQLPTVMISADAGRFDMQGLSLAGYVDDHELGLGKQTFALASMTGQGAGMGGGFRMQGLRMDYETRAEAGVVSSQVRPSLTLLEAANESFQDLSASMVWDGLDEQALRAINRATANHCQTQISDEQLQQIEQALLRLIDRGASFSINDLQGRQSQNRFGATMRIALAGSEQPGSAARQSLRDRLSVTADLRVSDGLVPPPLQEMVLGEGYARQVGDALAASLSLNKGALVLNNEPDAFGLEQTTDMFLAIGDESLQTWRQQIDSGNGPLMALARAGRVID